MKQSHMPSLPLNAVKRIIVLELLSNKYQMQTFSFKKINVNKLCK